MNIIELDSVSKSFGRRQVLRDVSLTVEEGSTVGIVGSNGSGKSVLFQLICGFTLPTPGPSVSGERFWGRVGTFRRISAYS